MKYYIRYKWQGEWYRSLREYTSLLHAKLAAQWVLKRFPEGVQVIPEGQ